MGIITNTLFGLQTGNNPLGADTRRDGDNNLRALAASMLTSFPGLDDIPCTKSGNELNDLAEKSAADVITGAWEFTASIDFSNQVTEFTDGSPVLSAPNGAMRIRTISNDQVQLAPQDTTVLTAVVGLVDILDTNNFRMGTGIFTRDNTVQPSGQFCFSMVNGTLTLTDTSGGANGWTVSAPNTVTMLITHNLGTASYNVVGGSSDSDYIIFAKNGNDFSVGFSAAGPFTFDGLVTLP